MQDYTRPLRRTTNDLALMVAEAVMPLERFMRDKRFNPATTALMSRSFKRGCAGEHSGADPARLPSPEIDAVLRVLSGYGSKTENCELAKPATLLRDLEATRIAITESLELLARVDALLSGRPTHRNLAEASDLLVRLEEVLAR